jgi:NMD protein affecting ribosome stability and mRNA decay
MALKYFCDICGKETEEGKVTLMGYGITDIHVLCKNCWKKAEKVLLKIKQQTETMPN